MQIKQRTIYNQMLKHTVNQLFIYMNINNSLLCFESAMVQDCPQLATRDREVGS